MKRYQTFIHGGLVVVVMFSMACSQFGERAATQFPPENSFMVENQRPALRKLFTPHPDTLKKHLTAEVLAEAQAYLDNQENLPRELRQAIESHEIWLGMTDEEVRFAIGEPTRKEQMAGEPSAFVLLYADEGWVLRFNEQGYLYELVER